MKVLTYHNFIIHGYVQINNNQKNLPLCLMVVGVWILCSSYPYPEVKFNSSQNEDEFCNGNMERETVSRFHTPANTRHVPTGRMESRAEEGSFV